MQKLGYSSLTSVALAACAPDADSMVQCIMRDGSGCAAATGALRTQLGEEGAHRLVVLVVVSSISPSGEPGNGGSRVSSRDLLCCGALVMKGGDG